MDGKSLELTHEGVLLPAAGATLPPQLVSAPRLRMVLKLWVLGNDTVNVSLQPAMSGASSGFSSRNT